jgi:ribose transport system substrate-binding protein
MTLSTPNTNGPFNLAMFTKNRENPAYAAARLGAERVAARMNAHVTHYVPVVPDSVSEQRAFVDQAMAANPYAVLFVATDAEAMIPSIKKLNAARIPVFSFVNRLLGGERVCHVGSDDVALAESICNYLILNNNLSWRVLVLAGTPGSMSGRDRLTGFARAFAAYPQVTRVADVPGEFLHSAARREMARVLNQDMAFDAILAANDAMALGAIDALEAAGKPLPPIVGVNAVPDAIAAIKTGKLLATASFDAMKMACLATEAAVRHLRGENVPDDITLPVEIVDRANCEAWDVPFEKRALPVWDATVSKSPT